MVDDGSPPHVKTRIPLLPNADPLSALLDAVGSNSPIAGLTHRFYRYPARFSPEFAARAIEAYTEPGDWVLDPFAGGGTTAVESLALGRRVVASDINALSGFVTRVKTTPITETDACALERWQASLARRTRLTGKEPNLPAWQSYQKNLPWWLRKTLTRALATVRELRLPRQQMFAKASLMRSAQWALDCRAILPTRADFLARHEADFADMLLGVAEYRARVEDAFGAPVRGVAENRRILVRSAAGLEKDARIPKHWGAPRLVLTSPPYVGVHIVYHRWQVRGRRETPAPYWLAGCLDGRPNTYYNFAERRQKKIDRYLAAMRSSFASITRLMDDSSRLVQLVAFAKPEEQLPAYLGVLIELGLESIALDRGGAAGGPISRTVPNRKWYADVKGSLNASTEYLLIHRKLRKTR